MADQKISELTELAAAPATDDMLAIVDTSVTTTKKISSLNLVIPRVCISTDFPATEFTSVTSGSGAVTYNDASHGKVLNLTTGETNSSVASIYRMTNDNNTPSSGVKRPAGTLHTLRTYYAGDVTAYFRWFTNTASDMTVGTSHQVGLKLTSADAGATRRLYASTGDGSSEQTTDISSYTTFTDDHIYAFYHDGTSVKFYVDGTLRATHTTNIPTLGTAAGLQGLFSAYVIGQNTTQAMIFINKATLSWEIF